MVKVAGDIAKNRKANLVSAIDVDMARDSSKSIEEQVVDHHITIMKDYSLSIESGSVIGRVNGLAVMGSGSTGSGNVLPIMATVTPGRGNIIATGMLKDIAQESIKNVSAVVKNLTGKDTKKLDIYIQFIQTYQGVEGDSASISVATAVMSAIENIPVKQEVAMTGSITVRGEVLPIGGVSHKIEAAAKIGLKKVIIPHQNVRDVVIDEIYKDKVEIIPVKTIYDVLYNAFDFAGHDEFLEKVKAGMAQ
jgi:Lon-like ATP-dependent protease